MEVRMMTGMRLLGGVGVLLSRMMGEISSERTSLLSSFLAKRSIGISRCGMGAKILGVRCSSGMPLSELVVTVGVVWGASTLHSDL